MRRSPRWILPLCLLAAAACGKSAGDAAAPAPAAAAQAAPAQAVAAQAPAAVEEGITLTMPKVDRYLSTLHDLALAAKADPALDDVTAMEDSETVDQYAARLGANAKVRGIVGASGMSLREFAQVQEAFLLGMMTQGAIKAGALEDVPAGVDPRNVEFVSQHQDEIAAKMKALEKTGSG